MDNGNDHEALALIKIPRFQETISSLLEWPYDILIIKLKVNLPSRSKSTDQSVKSTMEPPESTSPPIDDRNTVATTTHSPKAKQSPTNYEMETLTKNYLHHHAVTCAWGRDTDRN